MELLMTDTMILYKNIDPKLTEIYSLMANSDDITVMFCLANIYETQKKIIMAIDLNNSNMIWLKNII